MYAIRSYYEKINPNSAHVQQYRKFLQSKHNAALAGAGIGLAKKVYDYSVALNGFAVRLSEEQAKALAKQPDVVAVRPDEIRHIV